MAGLVLFMGCRPKPPPIPPFSPIGTWEMVSIDGKPLPQYFALSGGNVGNIETSISQNDFVFFQNGSWFWTLGLEMESDIGGGVFLKAQMPLAGQGSYTGSYTPAGGRMIIVQEDLEIRLTPEDFWASTGVSEADFKAAITRDWLFGKVENWTASLNAGMLTLRSSAGMEQVLRRK